MNDTMDKASDVLAELLKRMGILADIAANEEEDRIVLDVQGTETGLVIGKKGQTLDALQLVVGKMVGRKDGELVKPIIIDAEGYRARRAESLVAMAERVAEQVRRSNESVELEQMNAHDRRIIHVALDGVAGVTTRSEGEGLDRRLRIVPQPSYSDASS